MAKGLSMVPFYMIAALFFGCAPSGPTFANVQGVTIQKVGPNGTKKHTLEGRKELTDAASCLYQVKMVEEKQSETRQLLQTTYLIDVEDAHGIRSFELFTDRHLKGNKGKYYESLCLYDIVKI